MNLSLTNVPGFRRKEAIKKIKKEEATHDLVLKVIRWKSADISRLKRADRINQAEWKRYCRHIQNSNQSMSAKDLRNKLKTIGETVKKNKGFISWQ